jgi:predicted RNA-binding Zn-ribbon protein involved in translation (DUF1610 family)
MQYCEKCGAARSIRCAHNWEKDSNYDIFATGAMGERLVKKKVTVLRCTKCGELKEFAVGIDKE